ncbi:MAG: hypothetical protein WA655_14910 [Candidatus Korobacteraceae bacterium]
MRIAVSLLFAFLSIPLDYAQTAPVSAPPANASATGSVSMTSILPDLDRLQAAASQANLDLGQMRIEKWKADGDSKRQAQSNADSIQRNLTSALPGLIADVRSAPQNLGAEFKLYRNLNVLYDVLASVTESAGAFGSRSDYEALARQLEVIDSVRRDLAYALEQFTASTQSELDHLRTQVRTLQQAAAATPPPKNVVVDDSEPAKKTSHKKKTKPSTSTASGSDASSSSSSSNPPKAQ